jgi:hypothetical protein|tara:strand:- start:586 stop:765 length:180 start_codon:yes stop_codon:yes gene_type:complete
MDKVQSIYIVEKSKLHEYYTQLVGIYSTKELADQAGKESLEYNDEKEWSYTITIMGLDC